MATNTASGYGMKQAIVIEKCNRYMFKGQDLYHQNA